jgi:hypothetical protein
MQRFSLASVTYPLEKAEQRQGYRQTLDIVPIVVVALARYCKQEAS